MNTLNIEYKRDLSLMVKRMTLNHHHGGSTPLDLIKMYTAIG
jgi:hypothetical protein